MINSRGRGVPGCIASRALLAVLGLCAVGAPVSADGKPLIERVEPSVGAPGSVVRISGRRLRGQTQVQIGETALQIELCTPNLISARIAPGTASGRLSVRTQGGQVDGPDFTVSGAPAAPKIEHFQPPRAAAGAPLTIQGRGFSTRLAHNTVLFGAVPAIVSAATSTQLQVVVPQGASAGPISVRVQGAGEARSAAAFEPVPGLAISELTPRRAKRGERVELRGSGFDSRSKVFLGELALRVLELTPTRIVVALGLAAESGRVRVEGKAGQRVYAPAELEVIAPPELRAFSPVAGPPGTRIALEGSHLGSAEALAVKLGGQSLPLLSRSPTQLVVELPPAARSGKLAIELADFAPVLSAREFAVTEPLRFTAVRPQGGPVGSEVVLEGRGFAPRTSDNAVRFAGVTAEVLAVEPTPPRSAGEAQTSRSAGEAQTPRSAGEAQTPRSAGEAQTPRSAGEAQTPRSAGEAQTPRSAGDGPSVPEQLRVRVPAAKSGPIEVQVGAQRETSRAPFIVTTPPRVSRVSAELVSVAGELTLSGSGFGENPALVRVTLADRPLSVLSVRDDAIVVRAPPEPDSGELAVHVALQGSARYAKPIRVVAAR
jgi:hypothetical protein